MDTRRLLSYVRRAVDDYEMIAEGDRICVGISGGKDSLALLAGLANLRHFYPQRFELVALTVSPVSGGGISDERAQKRGNREYLAYFRFTGAKTPRVSDREIREFVKNENSIALAARYKG